jgi:hypothetical protein
LPNIQHTLTISWIYMAEEVSMTAVSAGATPLTRERRFFGYMAVAVFLTAIAGFASDVVVRHAWFTDFPWPIHVHAVIFSSWIVLYLVQSWLVVDRRNMHLHRQLGWFGAALAVLMVPLGIAGTMASIARGSAPTSFPPGFLLAINTLAMIGFGGLTLAAIRMRRDSPWHKRLMLSGTVIVIGPAIGRLLDMVPMGDAAPVAVIATMMLYVVVGIVFDRVTSGRIHPAYWWGAATIALVQLLSLPIGLSSPVQAFAAGLVH